MQTQGARRLGNVPAVTSQRRRQKGSIEGLEGLFTRFGEGQMHGGCHQSLGGTVLYTTRRH